MDNDEAEELGRFRRAIANATADQLAPILLATLDELINVVRGLPASGTGVEMAAALSAELHKRASAARVYAPVVGNA